MKKIALAFIASFGLFASAIASEKTETVKPKKETTASAKKHMCQITFKIYRNGFFEDVHDYTTFTDGSCTPFFKAMRNMMTQQGYHLH